MSAIRLDRRPDGVAVLTFDQPGRSANVLTPELWAEFDAALASVEADASVRGLVLASAKPGVFIAGADLKFFLNLPGPNAPECRAYMEQGLRVLERLERLPFPTCAAIDGAALGGGLEVALACDFRVCGTNPRVTFGLPEVTLGMIPGWGGTQRLPRIVDADRTQGLLLFGRALGSTHIAASLQLVDAVAETEPVIERAAAFLTLKSARKVNMVREKKRGTVLEDRLEYFPFHSPNGSLAQTELLSVLARGARLPLADAIKLETEAFLRLAGSDESKRLIAEFFAARRKPAPPESPPGGGR